MYVCMYVCIYVYIHIYIYTYTTTTTNNNNNNNTTTTNTTTITNTTTTNNNNTQINTNTNININNDNTSNKHNHTTKPAKDRLREGVSHRGSCKIPQMWAGDVMRKGITRTQAPKNARKPDLLVHTMRCTPTIGESSDNGHGNVS